MLSFSSCTETEFDDFSSTDWQLIKISLELPTANSPYTYALSTTNGNAVIAVKKSGTIAWSWHIWVTNYVPLATENGGYMDRNLGAIQMYPGASTALGLMYQWGRKDPFPGAKNVNNQDEPTTYNASGTISFATARSVNNAGNISFQNAVENPFTFYYSEHADRRDWLVHGGAGQRDDLWGTGSSKTVYDPCPPGWRVPPRNPWYSELQNDASFIWVTSLYGRRRHDFDYGGFYPAGGLRNGYNNQGILQNVGTQGYWRTDNVTTIYGSDLTLTSTSVSVTGAARAHGLSVRCKAE